MSDTNKPKVPYRLVESYLWGVHRGALLAAMSVGYPTTSALLLSAHAVAAELMSSRERIDLGGAIDSRWFRQGWEKVTLRIWNAIDDAYVESSRHVLTQPECHARLMVLRSISPNVSSRYANAIYIPQYESGPYVRVQIGPTTDPVAGGVGELGTIRVGCSRDDFLAEVHRSVEAFEPKPICRTYSEDQAKTWISMWRDYPLARATVEEPTLSTPSPTADSSALPQSIAAASGTRGDWL